MKTPYTSLPLDVCLQVSRGEGLPCGVVKHTPLHGVKVGVKRKI